tara:strand:+ start:3100 stop:3426 length:327 start_codon:yes stop_codon:yes gene_type:complete
LKFGTSNPNIIDTIGIENGCVVLSLIQGVSVDESSIRDLQYKFNVYLSYILDGQLEEEYPHFSSNSARIDLLFQYEPTGIARDFIDKAVHQCASEGVGVNLVVGAVNV